MKIIETSKNRTFEPFGIYKSEKEFISALRRGDESAYRQLYKFFAPKIALLAKNYRLHEYTEDIIQETILRVYNSIKKFRGECQLTTWLYKIAINVCNDTRKRQKKREKNVQIEETDIEEDYKYQIPSGDDIEENFFNEIGKENLKEALEKLSETERTLLLLKEIEDLSYEEIAKIFNIPVGTVRSRLHNTRKKLKDFLGG